MSKQNPKATVIAHGVSVEGNFSGESDMIIEGEVSGTVHTLANLSVGPDAKITASVAATNAVVAGKIRGNIVIEERLDLLESSVISGDVEAKILSVVPGAKINGKISMNGKKAQKLRKEKEALKATKSAQGGFASGGKVEQPAPDKK